MARNAKCLWWQNATEKTNDLGERVVTSYREIPACRNLPDTDEVGNDQTSWLAVGGLRWSLSGKTRTAGAWTLNFGVSRDAHGASSFDDEPFACGSIELLSLP